MTDVNDAFGNTSVDAQSRVYEKHLSKKSLRVAILGPNLDNIQAAGTRKRFEIRDALRDDGHDPFFPECLIDTDDPSQLWIRIERELLSASDVDLVIILHTPDAFGTLTEIANFVSVPEIHSKTAILFPVQFYQPGANLPANTVQAYFARKIYTESELTECHVVAECRKWAENRLFGNWPGREAQKF